MSRPVLHLISQAHLDPVWLWPWRDGMAEALTTVQSAADRAREIPDFHFTRSSVEVYRWIHETDPRLFAEIRRLIRAGRWEVIGGWIEQPDCNLPSTESFVRHSLLGQAWLQKHLGVTATIGYNVDSFGHAAGLPALLRRSGLDYYVFMRPQRHEAPEVSDLFWWESDDGSRVLTQRVPGEYSQRPNTSADELENMIRTTHARHFSPGFPHGIFWLGIGNHGGGPTREHLTRIAELQRDETLPELRYSTVSRYFAAVERSSAFAKLPTIKGELQFHARGCYVATSAVKSLNRRAERTLTVAETVCALSARSPQTDGSELREAWWNILFNQFHDLVAGTCVASAWEETRDRFGAGIHAAERVLQSATHRLARAVDTRGEQGSVLFVCNPLPWPRTVLVTLDTFSDPHGRAPITHLETQTGGIIPLQWRAAEANFGPHLMPWGKLTAAVSLPAGGYEVFRVAAGGRHKSRSKQPSRITLAGRGGISSWRTKKGRELLGRAIGFVVIEDSSDTWGHGIKSYVGKAKRPRAINTTRVEDGPLSLVRRQRFVVGRSTIWLDVVEHSWTEAIELRVRVDWWEERKILALEIPTRIEAARFISQGPGAVVDRRPDGEEQPAHGWTAVSGKLGLEPHTVGLVNEQNYSHSCDGGALRTLLVRSSRFAEHDPIKIAPHSVVPWVDRGWHECRFWLIEGTGDWRTLQLDRKAANLSTPAPSMLDSAHAGTEPWRKSFVELAGEHVSLLALKPAEKGDGWAARVQEMSGRSRSAVLRWPDVKCTVRFRLRGWEIKTFRIMRDGRVLETDLRENPLNL